MVMQAWRRSVRALSLLLATGLGCAHTAGADGGYRPPGTPAKSVRVDPAPDAAPAPPSLPEGVVPGQETRLRVPGDRHVIVVHAPAGNRQAIVYLHGVCGDIYAPRGWAEAASRFGTLVTMLGDEPCKGRKDRFRWYRNVERIDRRIRRALDAVAEARGGQLDRDHVTLVGYSQGADRAERIAARFHRRYPRVLLGSPSAAPDPSHFATGQAVAVVAGAREDNDRRVEGVEALRQAGFRARFMPLPEAYHGQYGPQGERVMSEALGWLFDRATSPSTTASE